MSFRLTRIIATLGPATARKQTLLQLIRAGVNVFRLNMSHGSYEDFRKWIRWVRQAARQAQAVVTLLMDLQGPKIRVGRFEDGFIHLNPKDRLTFTTRRVLGGRGLVPIQFARFPKAVHRGDRVYLNDGNLCVRVLRVSGKEVQVEVEVGGPLSDFKGVNLPEMKYAPSPITAKDRRDLEFGLKEGVDYVGLSFVGSAQDVVRLRRLIRKAGSQAGIIAKIERKAAVEAYREIIEEADGVMVARGDLGIEIPLPQVPVVQRHILRECAVRQKPGIVATQMLESMIENNRPTRAEVSDVSTAVMECADAVMLSAETATGKHPVGAVRIMGETARAMEIYQQDHRRIPKWSRFFEGEPPINLGIAYSANRMVELLNARALMVFTLSGGTARMVASPRPNVPIFAFTSNPETARRINLLRGVWPVLISGDTRFTGDLTPFFEKMKATRLVKKGDKVVLTTGIPLHIPQWTNVIRVEVVP